MTFVYDKEYLGILRIYIANEYYINDELNKYFKKKLISLYMRDSINEMTNDYVMYKSIHIMYELIYIMYEFIQITYEQIMYEPIHIMYESKHIMYEFIYTIYSQNICKCIYLLRSIIFLLLCIFT